jgi:hypothetical protein
MEVTKFKLKQLMFMYLRQLFVSLLVVTLYRSLTNQIYPIKLLSEISLVPANFVRKIMMQPTLMQLLKELN